MKRPTVQQSSVLKSYLDSLKGVLDNSGDVCIVGHNNIDVDGFLSGILLERLLNFLGYKARFAVLQAIVDDDTYNIINKLTYIPVKRYLKPIYNPSNVFLVDHHKSFLDSHVVGCIDHHPTMEKLNYEFGYIRESSATAFLIYEFMVEAGYPITQEDAKMVVIAMLTDTVSFRSSKAIPEEIKISDGLAKEFQLDYSLLKEKCLCLTDYKSMDIREIVAYGQKKYDFKGHIVESAYIQVDGMPPKSDVYKWLCCLSEYIRTSNNGIEMYVFIIFDTKINPKTNTPTTYVYQVTRDYAKKTTLNGLLSRGKDIMPLIEKRFNSAQWLTKRIREIVKYCSEHGKEIITMESCTGCGLAKCITDTSGASDMLRLSLLTYSNMAKIFFGVSAQTIEKYSVYSIETAIEMANAARKIASAMVKAVNGDEKSLIGIGITGQLGRIDPNNVGAEDDNAWYAIDSDNMNKRAEIIILNHDRSRPAKKNMIINEVIWDLYLDLPF